MNHWPKSIRSARNAALRASVSAIALAPAALTSPAFGSAALNLSPAALAQASGQNAAAARTSATQTGFLADSNIQAQIALSTANLAKAAQAFTAMTAAQTAARASSQLTLNNVPLSGSAWNGTVLSGLKPVNDSDPSLWINADPLQKDAASATATVKQKAANALLTWQSFDLNKGETIVFDQQDHSDWTVLNRVVAGPRGADGSRFVASPSMILGKVEATGSVYVINPNGIIFGPSAQVNVHSLIASSLDVGSPFMTQGERDNFFLNVGILGNSKNSGIPSFSYNEQDTVVEGDVKVEAGATIATSLAPRSVSPDAGGFVYLFAPNVENDGTIQTPAGETMLVAAQLVQLVTNDYPDGSIPASEAASQTFRAVGVDTSTQVWRLDGQPSAQISTPGSVTNNGMIDAERGVVILNGDIVTLGKTAQGDASVIRADTSITRNAQVFLDAQVQLDLAGGVIQMLPDENGESVPTSAVGNFHPGSVEMHGDAVDLEDGALIEAPGATVSIAAKGTSRFYGDAIEIHPGSPRLYMAQDAAIDVSGLNGVTLPMSANLLTFKPFGNEFADQPLQRQGVLRGQELTVDLRDTGTIDGIHWVGSPLADLAGYANNVPLSIDQLLTTGGTVRLASASPSSDIVLRQGSTINVAGGYIQYQGGNVNTTRLLTTDGRILDMADASPLNTYVGIAGIETVTHPHWGPATSETFINPLLSPGNFQPGYVEGHDAGGITLAGEGAYALDGTFYAGAIAGQYQRLSGQRASATNANTAAASRLTMPSAGYLTISGRSNLVVEDMVTPLPGDFSADDSLPIDYASNTRLNATMLSNAEFSRISAEFSGQFAVEDDAVFSVVPGGSIGIVAGSADIEGDLIARSGKISVESTGHIAGDALGAPTTNYHPTGPDNPKVFDVIVGSNALLDASGLWVNDTGAAPDALIGSAFIDGGSVSLLTDSQSGQCTVTACTSVAGLGADIPAIVDLTGDIVLSSGSRIDVSSGGRVNPLGLVKNDSQGRPAGKGGSVALQTYGRTFGVSLPYPPTLEPLSATIVLPGSDGSGDANAQALNAVIDAYGFSQGGTLSLQTASLQIGGTQDHSPDVFNLSADFFAGNAFGAYSLNAAAGKLTIAPGTVLAPQQKTLIAGSGLATLPTDSKAADVSGIGYLPDILRAPVNLTLNASLAPLPAAPYDDLVAAPPEAVALSIGQGAVIRTDPGATVALSVFGRLAYGGAITGVGTFGPPIAGQIGVADISGTIAAPGGVINVSGDITSEIWLGSTGRLDASGAVVADTRIPGLTTGSILSGGSVQIGTTGSFVAVKGAVIDVSGASGELDVPGAAGGAFLGPRTLWSDAGSIGITAATLLYDGSFVAHPGASLGKGGSLTISAALTPTAGNEKLVVQQTGSVVPDGLGSTDPLGASTGSILFSADRLAGSDIADLTLSASPVQGDQAGNYLPGTMEFRGNVKLAGLDSLALDASKISLTNVVAPADPNGCNVCLDAHYVALRGAGTIEKFAPQSGTGNLRISGGMIDIAAGNSVTGAGLLTLSGVAEANFISTGDIRLRLPLTGVGNDLAPGTLPAGELLTTGDLTLEAQQVYPVSSVDFTLKSTAADGTITFASSGTSSSPPLSAGGQITVSAANIVQGGTIVAPLGIIRLGAQSAADLSSNDPTRDTFVVTKKVTLAEGSVTSVSLSGQTVPYGETANGASWTYDSFSGQPIDAPPAKTLVVSGKAIDFETGASFNAQGGGDIQAMEFVPGIGGTRDVLAQANTYAIIPGYNPGAAPVDIDFALQQHDGTPAAGSSVYLSGLPGLPAGYYTLLPAHYATVPGAYRVALVPNSRDSSTTQNAILPDGTMRMSGYFANSANGTQDARTQLFDVQSGAVWRQYSEIDQTSANKFFGTETAGSTAVPPRLPEDAGHEVLNAVSEIKLDGLLNLAAAQGGRGAEFDIAAGSIDVLSPGAAGGHGVVLDATQLSNLGVESLLLGGIRTDTDSGQSVHVIANVIEVHNDSTAPLEAPEIILAANGGPSNGSDPLTLDAGSVIRATGELADPRPVTLTIGDKSLQQNGSGSLVAVSNGAPLIVNRQNVRFNNGIIDLAGGSGSTHGATIEGKSLTLDTTGDILLEDGSTLTGTDVSIAASSINIGAVTGTPGGLVVSPGALAQLDKAQTLTLRSTSETINFYSDASLTLAASGSRLVLDAPSLVAQTAGTVTLTAGEIDLINSGGAPGAISTGTSTLKINAGTIELGEGDKTLSGFAGATFKGTTEIAARDQGSLDGGDADLTFQTPLFLVGAGAQQTITTTGDAIFASSGANAPTTAAEIGGTLTVNAKSISDDTLIQATAGGIELHATTGDISLGTHADILARGYVQTFFDTTRVTYGGTVQLIADEGNIDADAASLIDVSSPDGHAGVAGSVELSAANGDIRSNGGAFNMAVLAGSVAGDGGGRLSIDAQSLGTDTLSVPSLFSDTVDVHVRQGDLQLGSNLVSQNVTLTADRGTITIAHSIDASGAKGGTISLFGGRGVDLVAGGQLLAKASAADKSGGEIVIGTEDGTANGSGTDGVIDLEDGLIDVSNTANAANGGTVRLRAPLSASGDDVSIDTVGSTIQGARSVTVEAFKTFDTDTSDFNGVIDPGAQPDFYGQCSAQSGSVACTGTLIEFVRNFQLSAAAQAKFVSIAPDKLHLTPGIELVNNDTAVNNGDITVASAWNLGAGFAGPLENGAEFTVKINNVQTVVPAGTIVTDRFGALLPQYASYKGDLLFVPGVSSITSLDYRVGGSPTGEAGTLTLRAQRDVNIDASITDGFFSTRNVFDTDYQQALSDWLSTASNAGGSTTDVSNVGGYQIAGATYADSVNGADPPPVAPYSALANGISPVSTAKDRVPIEGSDLFPLVKDPNGPIVGFDGNYRAIDSWSYRIVAGADVASANPLAVKPLVTFADGSNAELAGHGNVVLDGHKEFNLLNPTDFSFVTYRVPTIVRTGTGSIDIAAGRDFLLADTKAPGVVYTAGRNSVALPDPDFQMQTVEDPLNPGQFIDVPVANNPAGFLNPNVLNCDPTNFCNPYGPMTEAAYPVGGGHLTLTAQQDIIGFEHPTIGSPGNGNVFGYQQYFAPWLLAQGTALSATDFGAFSSLSSYLSTSGDFIISPSQTSWWINFGSFDQGLMSVGGDVRVEAGRDIQELSVSLPTTARFSGGLSSTITDSHGNTIANLPVMHLNASGDLTVMAGRDLKSGAFYEGSGEGTIKVGGSVSASWSPFDDTTNPVSTILALDTGTLSLTARGTVDIGGVVSGPSLQNVADTSGELPTVSLSLSSYGPDSKVTLQSVGGDVIANSLGNGGVALIDNVNYAIQSPDISGYPGVNRYPANFEADALHGDVTVEDSLQLAAADDGQLDLLAYGSLNFFSTVTQSEFHPISTGPSLVEQVFDPLAPLAGFGPGQGSTATDLGALLLHTEDDSPDLFYATTGGIFVGQTLDGSQKGLHPLSLEITKPSKVDAAGDIVDLSFFGQNLAPSDVTSITAGRDLFYTGLWQRFVGQQHANEGGLSLAGPGFFKVQAGRNLGPFVTAAGDIAAKQTGSNSPDSTGTGIITFGNTVVVGNRRMQNDQDPSLSNQFATSVDEKLPRQGADIDVKFGVANGIDYDAVTKTYITDNPAPFDWLAHGYTRDDVIETYIDPATATGVRSYGSELQTYVESLKKTANSVGEAWTEFQTLSTAEQDKFINEVAANELRIPIARQNFIASLGPDGESKFDASPELQHIFLDKVFFGELQAPGNSDGCCFKDYSMGYSIIEKLFPASMGYTNDGSNPAQRNATGNLDLLHATIKTLESSLVTEVKSDLTTGEGAVGGDVMVMGPGGTINVGTTAVEVNTKLSNSAVGLLTLDNGEINTFTDGSVLVNQSRILTVQGGDIVMWSSNADLDAGRGAKTTVDFKPLSVQFSLDDLQTINLNGLVSGAGIGTIKSTPDAPAASAFLIAPRGIVNAGDAGLRSSGNINIAALLVLNAANIATVGSVSGVPEINTVSLGALESSSAASGSAAQAAQEAVAAAANRGNQAAPKPAPSLITVEVFIGCDPDSGMMCTQP